MNTKHGIFLAIFNILVFCAFISTASAATIYVPDDYAKIQWAIDNATDGDTIIVRDGTYSENVDVNKRLTIRSENGYANCIVDATDPDGTVINVEADYVNISGFTVTGAELGIYLSSSNSTLTNNNASNNYIGILLGSSNTTLTNNIMSANEYNFGVLGNSLSDFIHNIDISNKVDGKPIYYLIDDENKQIPSNAGYVGIVNCTNVTVKNLTLTNNFQGVLLAYSSNSKIENVNASSNNCDGIYLDHSSNNTLINNNASNNYNAGIRLDYSNNNILTNNNASNNHRGIDLTSSNYNTLSNNAANSNNYEGIYLSWSSNYNTLSNNTANSNIRYYGIHLYYSSNNTLTNNNASNNYNAGIRLDYSNNNILTNNNVSISGSQYGIYFDSSSDLNNDIDTSNKINGASILVMSNVHTPAIIAGIDAELPSPLRATNYGMINLYQCSNVTIKNSKAVNNTGGYGIYVHSSDNNTLTNNDATYNDVGICLGGYSSENEIAKNNAYPNEREGIEIERIFSSERNKIYMNNFKGSTSGPTSGPPQIEFRSAPSLVVHFHYDMGMLVGATAYAGLENTGGSGAVEIVARISSPSGTIAMESSTFDVKSDGTYNLEIEITMCEVGVGVEEDYNLALSSPSASSSHEIGLGDYRSLSASISAINLIPVVSKNLWNSTEKITYTYKGKNCTNYLGNYWTDYEGIDANGDGIGDTPYYVQTDKDNYPLMEHWENYFAHQEQRGDLNSDGEVTSADAAIALWMAVSGAHNEGADVNRDGMATSLDALMILQAAAGNIDL